MLRNLQAAHYCPPPSFLTIKAPKKETPAQANGRRYEDKVRVFVKHWAVGHRYECKDHPWIHYRTEEGQSMYAQPDFVLLSNEDDNLIIVEAKLRHTRDAIAQLGRYRALIGRIHPEKVVSLVEICRYFDPSECRMELMKELKPHNLAIAAVLFEPQTWMVSLN